MLTAKRLQPILTAALSVALFAGAIACGGSASDPAPAPAPAPSAGDTPSTTQTARFDGETVFRGVFFGTGPVAAKLPELWTPERTEQMRQQGLAASQDAMVSYLDRTDASFFTRFAEEMQSADHVRIDRAMSEAGAKLADAASVIGVDRPAERVGNVLPVAIVVIDLLFVVWMGPSSDSNALDRTHTVHYLADSLARS